MIDYLSAEAAAIGCALIGDHGGEILTELDADDFASELLKPVFAALLTYWRKNGKIDQTAFVSGLDDEQKVTAVQCAETVISLSSWPLYVKAVKEAAVKRRVQGVAMQMVDSGVGYDDLQKMVADLNGVFTGRGEKDGVTLMDGVVDWMGRQQVTPDYIRCGFERMDKYTFIEPGDYLVIGGRPSDGKTAFALNLAVNMAKAGRRVVFFSLETRYQKIIDRLVAAFCNLSITDIKRRAIQTYPAADLDALAQLPITIVEASGKTVGWMRAQATRYKADIVVVDYLQLVRSAGKDRFEKVTNISQELHEMAQGEKVVVIALSQLARKGDRAPVLEDLRESGQIEQDADLIVLLNREKDSDDETIIIAKNKEGQIGDIGFHFEKERQRFFEYTN